MLTKYEKLISYLVNIPIAHVRKAWIARVRVEHEREDKLEADMVASGMERVECDSNLTNDGREVMRVRGRAYALRSDVHSKRLAQRMDAALRNAQTQQPARPVRESIAATTCPQMIEGKPCGASLNRKGVCPSCETGKMGYKYRYTCEVCGFDIVTMEALR